MESQLHSHSAQDSRHEHAGVTGTPSVSAGASATTNTDSNMHGPVADNTMLRTKPVPTLRPKQVHAVAKPSPVLKAAAAAVPNVAHRSSTPLTLTNIAVSSHNALMSARGATADDIAAAEKAALAFKQLQLQGVLQTQANPQIITASSASEHAPTEHAAVLSATTATLSSDQAAANVMPESRLNMMVATSEGSMQAAVHSGTLPGLDSAACSEQDIMTSQETVDAMDTATEAMHPRAAWPQASETITGAANKRGSTADAQWQPASKKASKLGRAMVPTRTGPQTVTTAEQEAGFKHTGPPGLSKTASRYASLWYVPHKPCMGGELSQ